MSRSWTRVFQGKSLGNGVCSYSVEFFEPYDEATPKVISLMAVDRTTCKVEFQIGVPKTPVRFSLEGGVSESQEARSAQGDALSSDVMWGYLSPAALDVLIDPSTPRPVPLLAGGHRKLTVTARWEDKFGIDVNKVLQAVDAKFHRDEIVDGKCKKDRWRNTASFWEDAHDGFWGEEDCDWTRRNLKGWVNARLANSGFPTCKPDRLYIYYKRLWARVNTKEQDPDPHLEGYKWGIEASWADGAACKDQVRWIDIVDYPGEFYRSFEDLEDNQP